MAAGRAHAAIARLTLAPTKARIGDAIEATGTVEAASGEEVDVAPLPLEWGVAQVLSGAWAPARADTATRVWKGTIAVYQLGAVTVPAIEVPVRRGGVKESCATDPVSLTIEGTLPPAASGEKAPDL